jgi:hypothetical protein
MRPPDSSRIREDFDDDVDQRQLLEQIDSEGWFGIAAEPGEDAPAFEYTVGLQRTFDHPEVIVFGLPFKTMHDLLWAVYRSIEEGRSFREEGDYDDLLESYKCAFRRVHPGWHDYLFRPAVHHRDHLGKPGTLAVMQLIWPDLDGRWPWDPSCDQAVGYNQMDLREAPEPAGE